MITDLNENRRVPVLETAVMIISIMLHYSSNISLKIFSASALLFIPLTVITALFYNEVWTIVFAFLCGVTVDVFANGTVCFNTVIMTVMGFLLAIAAANYVNKNVRSALCLSLVSCFVYFASKWMIFEFIGGVTGKVMLFMTTYIPSALYTAVFAVPLYYARAYLNKKHKQ